MATQKKSPTWLKDLLVAFAATTLSIILTFGTTGVINRVKQKEERKLTALMVMSSIEQFARNLEEIEQYTASKDSIATWLLSLSIEEVARLGDEPLFDVFNEVFNLAVISHDRTSEIVFNSHIDTWKNMGSFSFIDNVGWCFSAMNDMEEEMNKTTRELVSPIDAILNDIQVHPANYPGHSNIEKCLRNEEVRSRLKKLHKLRGAFRFQIANLRMENRNNMRLIGIPEEEVMDFTENKYTSDDYEREIFNPFDFEEPAIDIDSLNANLPIARQLDSLLHAK